MNEISFEEIRSSIVENFKGKGSFDRITKAAGGHTSVSRENRTNAYQ